MRFILVTLFFITLGSKAQMSLNYKPFELVGKINGKKEGVIYLSYGDKTPRYILDSAKIENGNFIFKGVLLEPSPAFLTNDRLQNDHKRSEIFIEPGKMNLLVEFDDFYQFKMIGSASQDEIELIKFMQEPILKEIELDSKNYTAAAIDYSNVKKNNTDSVILASAKEKFDSISIISKRNQSKLRKVKFDYIKNNPASYLGPYMLFDSRKFIAFDSLVALYNNFKPHIQESYSGIRVKQFIEETYKELGQISATNFMRKDKNNKLIQLNDFVKKGYVLLDFWASWCVPCREQNPHLIELYNKYRNKGFSIIGIAADNGTEAEWRKAIKKDAIDIWTHVLDKGSDKAENSFLIGDIYHVHSLPAKFLIDSKGIIIEKYGDTGKPESELDKKLLEIFGY